MRKVFLVSSLLLLSITFSFLLPAQDARENKGNANTPATRLRADIQRGIQNANQTGNELQTLQQKATVFLFLATDCPNSNSYAPELARIYRDYESRGVAFYSVYSDPGETAAGVRKHDSDYRIPFPALMDSQQSLAQDTGARVTPEAVVVARSGEELYRGRIDDRFANFGKTRIYVDKHDLRTALDQILAGKPVSNPDVPALGCAIPGVGQ